MNGGYPWLSSVLFAPLATAVILLFIPRAATRSIKILTILGSLATAVMVVGLVVSLGDGTPGTGALGLRFTEQHQWIASLGASYHLGLDGVSGWLLALDVGVFLLGAFVVSGRTTDRLKLFCGLLLAAETATIGVLLSVDLLLFYFFWEGMLIPLYFLLSSYGGPARGRATLKFVVYTVAASLLMLLSIIYLRYQSGQNSFDLEALMAHVVAGQSRVRLFSIPTLTPIQFAFIGFALAFAVKVPLVPFHTWLPDLYESCPVAALVFFAGIVSKLGAYGFIRFGLTLFPGPMHDARWILAALAVLSILYAAMLALGETDIKRIVAYSSVSHLGFVCLGIFALNANGINGAVMQLVNHGIIIAALFLVVGYIEQRTGTRDRHRIAGLERRMPWLYALFMVITLAGLGLPGMNSFAGEFTIMLGAFQLGWAYAVLAGFGVVLACWYMLRLHQGLMHEPARESTAAVKDLGRGEALALAPLVALMVFLGFFPKPVADIAVPSVNNYVAIVTGQPVVRTVGTLSPPPSPADLPGGR